MVISRYHSVLWSRAAGRTLLCMKQQTKRKPKLILAKDTVHKLTAPELSNVAGGAQTNHCDTITLKCCLTR